MSGETATELAETSVEATAAAVKCAVKIQAIIRGRQARDQHGWGLGAWEVESAPHDQARGENNPLYRGKRTTVDDEFVPWKQVWANYKPQTFTAKVVLENSRDLSTGAKWADPPEVDGLRGELEKRLTYEHGGIISFGGEGAPLNPRGRTGLRGRGLLGQWGPNHAADPIVTRREPLTNQLQVHRSRAPRMHPRPPVLLEPPGRMPHPLGAACRRPRRCWPSSARTRASGRCRAAWSRRATRSRPP